MNATSRIVVGTLVATTLGSCGAVPVTEPVRYRLDTPPVTAGLEPVDRVLRVAEVAVVAELDGDRMLVADGPVRVMAFRGHRFAAPLDRLVADALVTGLRRSGAFRAIRGALEPGSEDLELRLRVVDFHQEARDGGWVGLVTVDSALSDAEGRAVWSGELSAATPLAAATPEALAVALSASLQSLVAKLAKLATRAVAAVGG